MAMTYCNHNILFSYHKQGLLPSDTSLTCTTLIQKALTIQDLHTVAVALDRRKAFDTKNILNGKTNVLQMHIYLKLYASYSIRKNDSNTNTPFT